MTQSRTSAEGGTPHDNAAAKHHLHADHAGGLALRRWRRSSMAYRNPR